MNAGAPVLQTERLRLRDFGAGDVDTLVAMHREPRVRALLVDDFALDQPETARAFVAGLARLRAAHPGLGIWHAERRLPPDLQALREAQVAVARGELDAAALSYLEPAPWAFCGWFNLMPMPWDRTRVEIGCRLLPDAWGGGLALDGGEALLGHAFGLLQLHEVWAVCHPAHRSVFAVLLTLGFAPLGLADYGGTPAAHFRVDRAAWLQHAARPRRQRQREAHAALRERPGSAGLPVDTSGRGSILSCRAAGDAVNCGPTP